MKKWIKILLGSTVVAAIVAGGFSVWVAKVNNPNPKPKDDPSLIYNQ